MAKMRLNILNPATFFSLVWLVQILGYFFYRDSFGAYENETWYIVAFATSSFLVGSFVAAKVFKPSYFKKFDNLTIEIDQIKDQYFNHFMTYFCLAATFLLVLTTMKITDQILIAAPGAIQTFSNIRDIINYDFNNNRYFYHLFRYYHIIITSVLFSFCFLKKISRTNLVFLFTIGLLAALLTTSRLFLLFYILTIIAILFCHKKITTKQVFLALCSFAVVFFGIAIIIKKGYDSSNGPFEILKWNFQVYLFSPMAAFNHYVRTHEPTFDSIVMIPNSAKEVLQHFGFSFKMRTNLMPFVDTPLRTNVYTYLYPVYHDGGKALILFIGLILGFLHQTVYRIGRQFVNPITIYIFSISLYPIAVSFFEDAYFSSPGFVTFQILPLIVYMLFHYVRKYMPSTKRITT
jgi:oligosaccharide repeat unit polymerase